MACDHHSWFDLSAGPHNTHTLIHSHRITDLINTKQLPHPNNIQLPDMIIFVGGVAKERLLRGIVGKSFKPRRTELSSMCKLHADPRTAGDPHPLLIADCIVPGKYYPGAVNATASKCHETTIMTMISHEEIGRLRTSLFARVLGPFSSILCVFSADFGGLTGVCRFIESWMLAANKSSTHSDICRPRLLIIEQRDERGFLKPRWDQSAVQRLRQGLSLDSCSLESMFLSINILCIPFAYSQVSILQYISPLLQETRKIREVGRCQFSLLHLDAYLNAACRHWVHHRDIPFNFVKATHHMNPVSVHPSEHLERFLISSGDQGGGVDVVTVAATWPDSWSLHLFTNYTRSHPSHLAGGSDTGMREAYVFPRLPNSNSNGKRCIIWGPVRDNHPNVSLPPPHANLI